MGAPVLLRCRRIAHVLDPGNRILPVRTEITGKSHAVSVPRFRARLGTDGHDSLLDIPLAPVLESGLQRGGLAKW